MKRFDYNCFTGRWPFSKSRQADFDDLLRVHEKSAITSGFVSSLDSILYNDPMEGNLELAEKLVNAKYEIVPSMNPVLPNIGRDFRIAGESFHYSAVRIYPTMHGFDYDSPELAEFMDAAADHGKGVIIHTSFGDARLDYLLMQKPADTLKIPAFMEKRKDTPVVLCNMRLHEIYGIRNFLSKSSNVYVDMAELKHSMTAIDDLKEEGLAERLVFGSFYPMFDFSGAYIHFVGADKETVERILGNNIFRGIG